MPGGVVDTLITGFGPSAGMTRDSAGNFYVTDILAGTVVKMTITTGIAQPSAGALTASAFPNPFNNELNIRYALNENAPVTMEVDNLVGDQVFIKQFTAQSKGEHLWQWNGIQTNGERIASGVYLLKIRAGDRESNIKLMMQ